MATNNDFLLKIVTDIEDKLLDIFKQINIKEEIEVVLRECGKFGLNSETKVILKYIDSLTLDIKGDGIFPNYAQPARPDITPSPVTERTTAIAKEPAAEKPAAEEPAAEEPVTERTTAIAKEPAAEKPAAEEPAAEEPAAEETAAEKPAARSTAEEPAAEQDNIQQGGYKVKELFYMKGGSDNINNRVSFMKTETEKDENENEVEIFKYYAIESTNDIYLHVVKADGSDLEETDVKKIMSAGFKDKGKIEIDQTNKEVDKVNKFVIQIKFKQGTAVKEATENVLIRHSTSDVIEKIFLEKNDNYKPGYFMFYFPYGEIMDSMNESTDEKISQVIRGDEVESGKGILNFIIDLYSDSNSNAPVLSFNFQVLSENNESYTAEYKPNDDQMTLDEYLKTNVELGSTEQQSVIQVEKQPEDPQKGSESPEIAALRSKINKKREEIRLINEPPIHVVESASVGSALNPAVVEADRKAKTNTIKEDIRSLEDQIIALKESVGVGGGNKKRTYNKKKKRRSKKKRTPMKKKKRSKKKRTPMKKKIK